MLFWESSVLISSVLLSGTVICQLAPIVRTKNAQIVGTTTTTRSGRIVDAFRGIRYAMPPLGRRRFQDPVPADPIEGIFYATQDDPECVQRNSSDLTLPLEVAGNEDCLMLNIYTPHAQSSKYTKLPVMVYIYGGAFVKGSDSSKQFDPKYLLDADIILVVFNYRLDVFGFLSLGTEFAPGNSGLKDIVLALKWVNENVADFGGDPKQVTIIVGESVGGVSVHFLFYSHLAEVYILDFIFEDFFNGPSRCLGRLAIRCPIYLLSRLRRRATTRRLAKVLGCPASPSTALLECMQSVPADKIIKKQAEISPEGFPPFVVFSWAPVYDRNFSRNPFFSPNFRSSHVRPAYPWINGVNEFDGTSNVCRIYAFPTFVEELAADPWRFLPELLYLPSYLAAEDIPKVTDLLVKFYFGTPAIVTQKALVILIADAFFRMPGQRASLVHGGPVHYYEYAHALPQTWNDVYGAPGVVKPRPGHTDITLNLFEQSESFNRTDSASDVAISKKIVDLFTCFAITGEPSSRSADVQWNTVGNVDNFNYLHLGTEFVQKQNPCPKTFAFWSSLWEAYPNLY